MGPKRIWSYIDIFEYLFWGLSYYIWKPKCKKNVINQFQCPCVTVRVYLRKEGRIGAGYCKFLTMSMEFDKNPSKLTYFSIGYKNYIRKFFEHFPLKLLDPQKSKFGFTKVGLLNWYSLMKLFLERFW